MNRKQITIGVLALLMGTFVYLIDRPPDQTYFVCQSIGISFHGTLPHVFGVMGNIIPSFSHVFSFILITAGVLSCQKRGGIVICLMWLFVDVLFELGQKYSALPLRIIPEWFSGIPYLENSANYFRFGTFDLLDVVAIMLGSMAAYFILIKTAQGGGENDEKAGT